MGNTAYFPPIRRTRKEKARLFQFKELFENYFSARETHEKDEKRKKE